MTAALVLLLLVGAGCTTATVGIECARDALVDCNAAFRAVEEEFDERGGGVAALRVGENVCRLDPRRCELNALGPDWLAKARVVLSDGCILDSTLVHRRGEPSTAILVYPENDAKCR